MFWFTLIATFILVEAMYTRRRGLAGKLANNKGHHTLMLIHLLRFGIITLLVYLSSKRVICYKYESGEWVGAGWK